MDEYKPEEVSKDGRSNLRQGNYKCPKCNNTVQTNIHLASDHRVEIKCPECGHKFAVVDG